MKQQKEKISILGAGISGLTASILLSKRFEVTVHEKTAGTEAKPRHISALRNYDDEDVLTKAERTGIKLSPCKRIHQVHRFSPSGFSSTSHSESPIFYMFNRGRATSSVENQLYDQALAEGVKVFFNSKKRNADIIATGPTRKKANIFCYGMVYRKELDDLYMLYDTHYAPQGYISVLPSEREVQVCIVSFNMPVSMLKNRYQEAVTRLPVLRDLVAKETAISIVQGTGNYFTPQGQKDTTYYIGEAGGFQDPSRGFGIWNAILSAQLAAKSIIERRDYNELIEESYMKEYRSSLERRREFDKLDNQGLDRMILDLGERVELKEYLKKRI